MEIIILSIFGLFMLIHSFSYLPCMILVSSIPTEYPKQYTWVYCECGNELCSDGSYEGTYLTEFDVRSVRYICKKCGDVSWFDFDRAPVPIKIHPEATEQPTSDLKEHP